MVGHSGDENPMQWAYRANRSDAVSEAVEHSQGENFENWVRNARWHHAVFLVALPLEDENPRIRRALQFAVTRSLVRWNTVRTKDPGIGCEVQHGVTL